MTDHPAHHYFQRAMAQAAGFEPHPTLAIAISGGADSVVLFHWTKAWAEARQGRVVALTVDHGLRDEAADEARIVAEWSAALGVEHQILTVAMDKQSPAIQQQARDLRYAAMEDYCQQRGILHLLTAHHLDDQAETLAMRAWRGSGVDGLAGIPFIRYTPNIRIIRPLLHVPKSQIMAWLTEYHIQWLEDPSNATDKYERNRIRKHLATWPVPPQDIINTTRMMGLAKLANGQKMAELAVDSVRWFEAGYLELHTQHWHTQPNDQLIGLLTALIHSLGSTPNPPRYYQMEGLLESILVDSAAQKTCLAGLVFSRVQPHHWRIVREPQHCAPAATLLPDQILHWDQRFTLHSSSSLPLYVAALGPQGIATLKNHKAQPKLTLPREAMETLPAIWHLDHLAVVPHIDIELEMGLAHLIRMTAKWQQPLLGSAHRYLT